MEADLNSLCDRCGSFIPPERTNTPGRCWGAKGDIKDHRLVAGLSLAPPVRRAGGGLTYADITYGTATPGGALRSDLERWVSALIMSGEPYLKDDGEHLEVRRLPEWLEVTGGDDLLKQAVGAGTEGYASAEVELEVEVQHPHDRSGCSDTTAVVHGEVERAWRLWSIVRAEDDGVDGWRVKVTYLIEEP